MNEDRLRLVWATEPFETESSTGAPDAKLLQDPQTLWLRHTTDYEQFAGVNGRADAFLNRAGFLEVPVRTYYDSNGRGVFETFRLRKAGR